MTSFFIALQGSWLGSLITLWPWAWPIAETIHFFGMAILFGAIVITDLRLIGCFKAISFKATHALIIMAIIGFVLNLITGVLFFANNPLNYLNGLAFQLKLVFLVIAGLNALWFTVKMQPVWNSWDQHGDAPRTAQISGYISLISWTLIAAFGRLIPYLGGAIG